MPQLPVIPSFEPPSPARTRRGPSPRLARLKSSALQLYRLSVVVVIVWLIHRHQSRIRVDGDAPIRLEEVRPFFPGAARLEPDTSERMGLWVIDRAGRTVGYVVRTSPVSDHIIGYCGPTDTLIALTPDVANMRVVGIKVRSSRDTKEHVGDVVANDDFMATWNGKTWDEVADTDPRAAGIEGVSGASMTSLCIANSIRARLQHSNDAAKAVAQAAAVPIQVRWSDIGLVAVLALAVLLAFTHLRSKVWLRRTFQVLLIVYVGFINGQLLSQSLFGGWSSSSLPWRAAPGLVLLAAAALIVPWTTRRQLYCSQICPHGAAQELVGRLTHRYPRLHLTLPRGIERGLRWLPAMLVALVLFIVIVNVPFDLAGIEPFDAYLIRAAGAATIAIAVAGLVAAAFVPMAYCKYGCPTGMVLSFVRSHGKADGFGRRDIAALLLVLWAIGLYLAYEPLRYRLIGSL